MVLQTEFPRSAGLLAGICWTKVIFPLFPRAGGGGGMDVDINDGTN